MSKIETTTVDSEKSLHLDNPLNVAEKPTAVAEPAATPPVPLLCNFCDKEILSKCELDLHISRKHPTLECDDCSVYFSTRAELREHMAEEHESKPDIKCSECGTKVQFKDDLHDHVHYKCKQCGQWFNDYFLFLSHMGKEHSLGMPYPEGYVNKY